jgi:sec-independent protein translocase protein TatC
MELVEHLAELRTHIVRSLWYIVLGAFIAYQFFTPLYGLLHRPLEQEMKRQNEIRSRPENRPVNASAPDVFLIPPYTGDPKKDHENMAKAIEWVYRNPSTAPIMANTFRRFSDPFMVRLQLSIIFGLILALPLVMRELAMFILPAMTPQERRPLRILVPVSVFLLIFGVTVAYRTLFFAIPWFMTYLNDFPPPNNLLQDPNDYILFFMKMMAAFGIAFQLPVVMMILAFLGLVTSKGLLQRWRWGVVIGAAGGLFIPTNDLISMGMISVPLMILYFVSILLVRIVEKMKKTPHPKPRTAG